VNNKQTLAILSIVAISFSAIILLGMAQQQNEQYVVINAQNVLMKSNVGQQLSKELEAMQQQEQQKLSVLQNELRDLQKQAQSPTLSEDERQRIQTQYQQKQVAAQRAVQDAQRMIQQESQKRLQELEKLILPVIQTVARENGFKMVFDATSAGMAYFDASLDITDLVVQRLNSMQ